jgi:hypothetical protein
MQIPPKSQKAVQEPLKGSAEANLSDEQDDSPQQEQGTGRKSYDGSHGLGSFQGTVIDRSKKKPRFAPSAQTAVHIRLLFQFYFASLMLICPISAVF